MGILPRKAYAPPRRSQSNRCALGTVALTVLLGAWSPSVLGPGAARAELPPWVYGEQQREAPVVMRLAVRKGAQAGGNWQVRAQVLKVIRQPSHGQLQANQQIVIRYPLPDSRSPRMVGPSPVPLLKGEETVTAWLSPIPGEIGVFAPAAGGRSFGPSLEAVVERR